MKQTAFAAKGAYMGKEFSEVLKEHRRRYPLMQPQDVGKLIFQSEFGPRHLLSDGRAALFSLQEERKRMSNKDPLLQIEDAGGAFCRFPLANLESKEDEELLVKLFEYSAKNGSGTMDGVLKKLDEACKTGMEGMEAWAKRWKEGGFFPVRHSEIFRKAYGPHYRLLRKECAVYFPALQKIARLSGQGAFALVGVDGRCGSGKTRFASLAKSLFDCNVLHMDDFYLPPERRKQGWEESFGGNIDFDRFYEEALAKAKNGEALRYRPFCCRTGRMETERLLAPRMLTVAEGSYSHHPVLREKAAYDFSLFLTCSGEEQKRRLVLREGSRFDAFREKWIPMEERYFSRFGIEARSDMRIETDFLAAGGE